MTYYTALYVTLASTVQTTEYRTCRNYSSDQHIMTIGSLRRCCPQPEAFGSYADRSVELVLDAQVAAKQPVFVEAARASGTPVLVDPLTFFLQDEVTVGDSWERLPYGRASAVPMTELEEPSVQNDLISSVIEFELHYGATALVAPYLLLDDDPSTLRVNLKLLTQTRSYMESHDIQLPLIAVLAMPASKSIAGIAHQSVLELFANIATSVSTSNIALALSGTGGADDRLHHVQMVLQDTNRALGDGSQRDRLASRFGRPERGGGRSLRLRNRYWHS